MGRHCAVPSSYRLSSCRAPIDMMQCWLKTCPKQCKLLNTWNIWPVVLQMWKTFRKLSLISVVLLENLSLSGAINPSVPSRNLHAMSMNMQSGVHVLGGRWSVGGMLWSLVVSSSMCCRFFPTLRSRCPLSLFKTSL